MTGSPRESELITLRPSTIDDRKQIFEWLTNSDLTPLMLGAPGYPENPIPTWDEFTKDYVEYFFDGSQPKLGRCFIILRGNEVIGQVNYDVIHFEDNSTEIDIWLSGSKYMNKGYGTEAIKIMCDYLNREFGCKKIIIAPSRRNAGAVRCYQKAGFVESVARPLNFSPDYSDTVIMVKSIDK